jgi:hypothetical protein
MAQWCNLLPWNTAWGSVLALFYLKTKSPNDILSFYHTQSDRSFSVIQLPCDLYTIRGTEASSLLARLSRVATLHQFGYDITTFYGELVEVLYLPGRQAWGTQITSNKNWFGKIRIQNLVKKYSRVCQDQRNANPSRYTSNRRRRWNRGCFVK